jgi:hypothetical protein
LHREGPTVKLLEAQGLGDLGGTLGDMKAHVQAPIFGFGCPTSRKDPPGPGTPKAYLWVQPFCTDQQMRNNHMMTSSTHTHNKPTMQHHRPTLHDQDLVTCKGHQSEPQSYIYIYISFLSCQQLWTKSDASFARALPMGILRPTWPSRPTASSVWRSTVGQRARW